MPPGWVTNEQFVAGYGAAQAVPGPALHICGVSGGRDASLVRWLGGGSARSGGNFLPSFLLIVGGLPLWNLLRAQPSFKAALRGINAAVVGLLLAALYHPVWTSAMHAPADFALGLVNFLLLAFWKWPPWLVVVGSALAGAALAQL